MNDQEENKQLYALILCGLKPYKNFNLENQILSYQNSALANY